MQYLGHTYTKQTHTTTTATKPSVLYFYFLILATLVIPSLSEGEKGGHWVEWNEGAE